MKNQVSAFANETKGNGHVVLVSTDWTTVPNDTAVCGFDGGFECAYALNGEAFTMGSGVSSYTIVKPNALNDGEPATKEIVCGHNDEAWSAYDPQYRYLARHDLARLLVFAVLHPEKTSGLRFDVTALAQGGTPTVDVSEVFQCAMFSWDPRKKRGGL